MSRGLGDVYKRQAKGSAPESCVLTNINREARLLLAEYLGAKIDPDCVDYISKISDRLDDTTIEAQSGELVRNVSKLCAMPMLDASVQFIRYSIYISSNNLLSNTQTDKFLQWTLRNGVFWILEELLKLKLPTIEILASNLLLSAVRQGDIDTVRQILENGVEINSVGGRFKSQSPLLEAVRKNDSCLVQLWLGAGCRSKC